MVTTHIPVLPHPYALATATVNGHAYLYVTHLLSLPRAGGQAARDDGREGRVTVLDPGTASVVTTIVLPPDSHGFPNLLAGITVDGSRAWVATVRDAPDLPNGLTTTVFAAVSTLDLAHQRENIAARVALNDIETFGSPVNNPVAVAPSPDGKRLYVVLAGSNLVEVVDIADPTQPMLYKFLATGDNPRAASPSAQTAITAIS